MSWDAIGAIGEVIGAIAVVLTVAYLAVQIRNESKRADREDRRARTERLSVAYAQLADSDHLPGVLIKVSDLGDVKTGWRNVSDLTSLDPVEAIRYSFSRQGMLHGFQHTFLDTDIDPEEVESAKLRLRYTIKQDGPAFEALWTVLGDTYLPQFKAFVDEELERVRDDR